MTDPDIWVLGAATKARIVWGGAENVPGLIAVTTHHKIFIRGAAMDVPLRLTYAVSEVL